MPYRAFLDNWKETEPDFVNEIGVEFRAEISLTSYARNKLSPEYVVWMVSGTVKPTYLITEGQREVFDDSSYEGIACRIDAMSFIKRSEENEQSAETEKD